MTLASLAVILSGVVTREASDCVVESLP
jgi:hypothetical protein